MMSSLRQTRVAGRELDEQQCSVPKSSALAARARKQGSRSVTALHCAVVLLVASSGALF